jgi:hypothetical protein
MVDGFSEVGFTRHTITSRRSGALELCTFYLGVNRLFASGFNFTAFVPLLPSVFGLHFPLDSEWLWVRLRWAEMLRTTTAGFTTAAELVCGL